MFWIGLIVGIIFGIIALAAVSCWWCATRLCGSWEEFGNSIVAIGMASAYRESELQVVKDGEILDRVVFEEGL